MSSRLLQDDRIERVEALLRHSSGVLFHCFHSLARSNKRRAGNGRSEHLSKVTCTCSYLQSCFSLPSGRILRVGTIVAVTVRDGLDVWCGSVPFSVSNKQYV